jgi:hypothetical protein
MRLPLLSLPPQVPFVVNRALPRATLAKPPTSPMGAGTLVAAEERSREREALVST